MLRMIITWYNLALYTGLYGVNCPVHICSLSIQYRHRTGAVLNYVYSQLKCSSIKNVYVSNEKTEHWNKLSVFIWNDFAFVSEMEHICSKLDGTIPFNYANFCWINFHLFFISFTSSASGLSFFHFFFLLVRLFWVISQRAYHFGLTAKNSVCHLKVENCSVYIYIAIAFSILAAFCNCCRIFLILPWKCFKVVLNFTTHWRSLRVFHQTLCCVRKKF